MNTSTLWHDFKSLYENFLNEHFEKILRLSPEGEHKHQDQFINHGQIQLIESMKYSLFNGGKRFRPRIGFIAGTALKIPNANLIPWLGAVECIHTYSLIHDDLPAMDNDSVRRGKPTNHIVYGESTALLAGDALLTEAFSIISEYYAATPEVGLQLVRILAKASGIVGMVGGQALDLSPEIKNTTIPWAKLIHQLKTGSLIQSVIEGVSTLSPSLNEENKKQLIEFGALLGLAFQVKDDLLDHNLEIYDPKNLVCHMGESSVQNLLKQISTHAEEQILFLGNSQILFKELLNENYNRLF